METFNRFAVNGVTALLLFGLVGCTVIGAGIGAIAGSGSGIGVLGGAAIGGVIGYEVGK